MTEREAIVEIARILSRRPSSNPADAEMFAMIVDKLSAPVERQKGKR